jgi:hypothetical protein
MSEFDPATPLGERIELEHKALAWRLRMRDGLRCALDLWGGEDYVDGGAFRASEFAPAGLACNGAYDG